MRGKTVATLGWICLGIWFVTFELAGHYFEGWFLTNQWHEWMLQIPPGLAWVAFAAYIGIGLHLWWPLISGGGR